MNSCTHKEEVAKRRSNTKGQYTTPYKVRGDRVECYLLLIDLHNAFEDKERLEDEGLGIDF